MNEHSLRISLFRLGKKKIIKRICRGFYANPFNLPTLEEISAQIYQPSYISLESALYSYGILSQIPQVLTCVTTRLPHTFRTNFGVIEYRQIKKRFFWGFIEKEGFLIAEAEKALLDYLYLNKKEVGVRLSDLNLSVVDMGKLRRLIKAMDMEEIFFTFQAQK
jgi:predicted transcriptional regulator of viral defense system